MPNVYHAENGTSFSEGASSALIASAIYRLAQMEVQGAEAFVPQAERIRQATYNNIDEETGWIKHVVDPLDWYVEIDQSPEAQAFTLLMESAWRGYTGQDGVGATQAVESDTSKGSS